MGCSEGVEYQNRSVRRLINDAEGEPFGGNRRGILTRAIRDLDASQEEDPEARAIVLAMLAQENPGYLAEAGKAFEESVTRCVQLNWIRLHLAEAWHKAGNLVEAFRFSSSVQREYFDGRDLHWRSVRMGEINAVALLRLGRMSDGVAAALAICDEFSFCGDIDDLAPPYDLMETAAFIATGDSNDEIKRAGCSILRTFSRSVELASWFNPVFVQRISAAMVGCE
ncbi:hypothetical protein [Frankia sp. Cr2]|uniref:hypothetical protein n=1 Tax=Frankia sp. Cr2 TaxID=3073932 RepID=UPI002AD21464|nr:hypothetical protein [Frankia sp. Cr2]